VRPGYIFVAILGADFDGHDFIPDAIAQGAIAIVGERPNLSLPVLYVPVQSSRAETAELAAAFFRQPSHDLKVIGVTGTNGKTSVVFWLTHLLRAAGISCGMVSSVLNDLGGESVAATLTTPESPELQSYLARMRDGGMTHAVVEVSSHGIVQHRVDAISFHLNILTNITREHLDFHGTMEQYVAAKASLFERLAVHTGGAVLNADDFYFRSVLDRLNPSIPVLSYGIDSGEIRATSVKSDGWWTKIQLRTPQGEFDVRLDHPGRYNVYNLLAAVAAASVLGLSMDRVVEAISTLPPVPGRMQWMPHGADAPTVIIDYAHTPDGLLQVLRTVRQWHPQTLWLVFGARGGRDWGKHPQMGEIAATWADRIVVTSDSPYHDDPTALAESIVSGIIEVDRQRLTTVNLDRASAIATTIAQADRHDVVLITGRGPETVQTFGDIRVRAVDSEMVTRALENRR